MTWSNIFLVARSIYASMAIQQVGYRGQLNLRPYLFAATVGCIQSGTDACKAGSALNRLLHIHVDRPHTWSQTTHCISTSEQASTFYWETLSISALSWTREGSCIVNQKHTRRDCNISNTIESFDAIHHHGPHPKAMWQLSQMIEHVISTFMTHPQSTTTPTTVVVHE